MIFEPMVHGVKGSLVASASREAMVSFEGVVSESIVGAVVENVHVLDPVVVIVVGRWMDGMDFLILGEIATPVTDLSAAIVDCSFLLLVHTIAHRAEFVRDEVLERNDHFLDDRCSVVDHAP